VKVGGGTHDGNRFWPQHFSDIGHGRAT
jgi:hypothetical protein